MSRTKWVEICNHWKEKWPVYLPEHAADNNGLDIYEVLESISDNLTDKEIVMVDAGSPSYAGPTNLKCRAPGQFIFNSSQADMGWAVPASIGVALNALDKTTLVIVGDGSFYSNMQELAVIRYHQLPVKIIVLDNDGYLSIKNTQTKYFEGRVSGINNQTGLFFADLEKVADTFDMKYTKLNNRNELRDWCGNIQSYTSFGPEIIHIKCKTDQEILPAQAFRIDDNGNKIQASLHDMLPFLSDDELKDEWPK